jgi:SAM-dependent methyltransferase
MNSQLVQDYEQFFGRKYLSKDIFDYYPEATIIPQYLRTHFPRAEVVLDLGFGTGLWFWASFLPSLKQLDGIDLYEEALDEANEVFRLNHIPDGYAVAHNHIGDSFMMNDLANLKSKAGNFAFQDYRETWPPPIGITKYDLVTEHGGGFGQMDSQGDITDVIKQIARVLKDDGYFFFLNFRMKYALTVEDQLDRVPKAGFHLSRKVLFECVKAGGMKMVDFHTVLHPMSKTGIDRCYYGYAKLP